MPHTQILKCLEMYNINRTLRAFIKNSMGLWKTTPKANSKPVPQVTIVCSIYQGDALSPLLFCIGLNPLSQIITKSGYGYRFRSGRRFNLSDSMCSSTENSWKHCFWDVVVNHPVVVRGGGSCLLRHCCGVKFVSPLGPLTAWGPTCLFTTAPLTTVALGMVLLVNGSTTETSQLSHFSGSVQAHQGFFMSQVFDTSRERAVSPCLSHQLLIIIVFCWVKWLMTDWVMSVCVCVCVCVCKRGQQSLGHGKWRNYKENSHLARGAPHVQLNSSMFSVVISDALCQSWAQECRHSND